MESVDSSRLVDDSHFAFQYAFRDRDADGSDRDGVNTWGEMRNGGAMVGVESDGRLFGQCA